ncbi:cilia-and flagella-associated protein 96-like isoform X2 [Rhodnius prolixus]|uniref:cilia-and flagella-associated protein 96-like isoform X2 n=1 Tax=Rhodnius prolixus TaxID=13249 RepID=UPI003D18B603
MAVKKRETLPEYGRHFGKYDLERWGDFAEMSYLHGISYGRFGLKLSDREKGRQMLAKFPKIKAGLQDCYFEKDLKRIFIGEAYKPLYKTLAKESLERNKKFLSPRGFLNPGFPKLHSTPGDHYGTFAGKYEAFSAKTRPPEKKVPVKRNFYSSPGRKGSYGYVNTCINPYPRYPESGIKYEEKPPPERKYTVTNPPFKGPSPPNLFDTNPYPEPPNANMNQPIYKKFVDQRWLLSKEFRPAGRGKPVLFLLASICSNESTSTSNKHKSQHDEANLDGFLMLGDLFLPESGNTYRNVKISYGDEDSSHSYEMSQ